jgi:hypothetical protein
MVNFMQRITLPLGLPRRHAQPCSLGRRGRPRPRSPLKSHTPLQEAAVGTKISLGTLGSKQAPAAPESVGTRTRDEVVAASVTLDEQDNDEHGRARPGRLGGRSSKQASRQAGQRRSS